MIILAAAVIAGIAEPEYVTRFRQKMLTVNDVKICVYRGVNGTVGYHYPTRFFRECPRQFQCKYQPNKAKRPTINEILKGVNGGF